MSVTRVVKVEEHPSTILAKLNGQRECKELCDVIIKVKDRSFCAHRNVLAAGSDYFSRMFTTEMKEKYQKTVTIHDVTPAAVEKVFDFLYSDEVELCTEGVRDILHAASVMQVQDLLVAINDFLSDATSISNCLNFRELGRFYSLENLADVAHRCILENFEKVSKQTEFTDLSLDYLEEILLSDDLMVASESIVYEALVRWTRRIMDERRGLFPRYFKHIRLQQISPEYLSTHVSQEPLVREFHDCRDLVDEAFRFHLKLDKEGAHLARKGQQTASRLVGLFNSTRSLHIFNIETKRWSYVTHQQMTTPNGSSVCSHNGEIYICLSDNSRRFYVYDNEGWREESLIPNQRVETNAVFVGDNMYMVGRLNSANGTIYNNVLAYDFDTKAWSTLCNVQTNRFAMASVACKGEIYVLGGFTNAGRTQACCSVEVLDPVAKTWTQKPNMNTERAKFGAVLFGDRIYAFGGVGNNGVVLSSVEFMDVEESVWTNLRTEIPVELGANSASCVGNQVVVLGKENVLLSFDPCAMTWKAESQILPSLQGAKVVTLPWNEEPRA